MTDSRYEKAGLTVRWIPGMKRLDLLYVGFQV
jgi:hypothetical protein